MYSPGKLIAGSNIFPFNGLPPVGTDHVPPVPGFPVMTVNKSFVLLEHTLTLVSCGVLPKPE